MTESQIERLAEQVLEAHALNQLPVDPLRIAELEKIRLAPGDYGGCFDARIEYRHKAQGGAFYLFYTQPSETLPASRVRFSLAHELGHFYIPAHRQYLVTGEWQGKHRQFLSSSRMEREANWFAAALLMPRQIFIERMKARTTKRRTLTWFEKLADDVFHTSLVSTLLRYVQLNFEPCAVIFSERGELRFAVLSDAMRQLGYQWVQRLPEDSLTMTAWRALKLGKRVTRTKRHHALLWFSGVPAVSLIEEITISPQPEHIVTHLTFPSSELSAA